MARDWLQISVVIWIAIFKSRECIDRLNVVSCNVLCCDWVVRIVFIPDVDFGYQYDSNCPHVERDFQRALVFDKALSLQSFIHGRSYFVCKMGIWIAKFSPVQVHAVLANATALAERAVVESPAMWLAKNIWSTFWTFLWKLPSPSILQIMRAKFCFVTHWAIKLALWFSHATAKVIWSALDAEFFFFSMGAFFVDHWQVFFAYTKFSTCIALPTQRMLTCPVWHFFTFCIVPHSLPCTNTLSASASCYPPHCNYVMR